MILIDRHFDLDVTDQLTATKNLPENWQVKGP